MKELLEHEGRKIGMKHPPTINRVYLGEAILFKEQIGQWYCTVYDHFILFHNDS